MVLPVAYLGVRSAGVGNVVGVEGHHVAEHVGGGLLVPVLPPPGHHGGGGGGDDDDGVDVDGGGVEVVMVIV